MIGDERLSQLSHQLMATLSAAEMRALFYEWRFWARAAQLPPKGEWRVWLLLAGRGFGKTRTGAEWVRALATSQPHCEIGLIGATFDDVRHVMVDGPSGIVTISPPEEGARYYPSRHQILWPNGAKARLFAADGFVEGEKSTVGGSSVGKGSDISISYFTPSISGIEAAISYTDAGDESKADSSEFGLKFTTAIGVGDLAF